MLMCSCFGPLVEDTDNDAAAGTIIDPWLSIGTSLLRGRWGRCRVRAAVSIRSSALTTAAWSEPDAVASRSEAMGPEPHARWEARSVTTVWPLLAALARAAFPPPPAAVGVAATMEEAGGMLFIVVLLSMLFVLVVSRSGGWRPALAMARADLSTFSSLSRLQKQIITTCAGFNFRLQRYQQQDTRTTLYRYIISSTSCVAVREGITK